MSVDYSRGNIAASLVVLKAMWAARGGEPLVVTLALTPADKAAMWQREARKFLLEQYRRRQAGQAPISLADLNSLQEVPVEWDELAGERPGEDDPLLAAERKEKTKFYLGAK